MVVGEVVAPGIAIVGVLFEEVPAVATRGAETYEGNVDGNCNERD